MDKLVRLVGGFALPDRTTPKNPFLIDEGKRHAQQQSFAIVRALSAKLESVGLSEKKLWDWIKDRHGVESRSELSELQYVVISARLSAAQQSPVLFDSIVRKIKLHVKEITGTGQCRVLRANYDGTYKTVYEGSFTDNIHARAKLHADNTGHLVHVFLPTGDVKSYHPEKYADDPNCPPIEYDPGKPARAFEMKSKGNEKHRVEIQFPSTPKYMEWGQQQANSTGNKIVITCLAGHYVLFSFDCHK